MVVLVIKHFWVGVLQCSHSCWNFSQPSILVSWNNCFRRKACIKITCSMNDSEMFERINKINSMIVLILQTKVAQ
jgi:hypothetical protein